MRQRLKVTLQFSRLNSSMIYWRTCDFDHEFAGQGSILWPMSRLSQMKQPIYKEAYLGREYSSGTLSLAKSTIQISEKIFVSNLRHLFRDRTTKRNYSASPCLPGSRCDRELDLPADRKQIPYGRSCCKGNNRSSIIDTRIN